MLFYYSKSDDSIMKKLDLQTKQFVLATVHRAENTDDLRRLTSIIQALNELNKDQTVIVPLHPRTRKLIRQLSVKPAFRMIDPVGYLDMLQLLNHCSLVITDSGGLQKEAYWFKKFSVVLREQTEWIELQENGFSELAGSNPKKIADIANRFLQKRFVDKAGLYGEGWAGEKIVNILEQYTK
jgi:UDP-GlcNAc3NAcA epimerase